MLTYTKLAELTRELEHKHVLTVYLDGTTTDHAQIHGWRRQLDVALKDIRAWMADSSYEEKAELERCVGFLEEELSRMPRGVGSRGWATFITATGIEYAEHLPVPMPTMAVWSTGVCVAPYIRALKENKPVVVVIVDRKAARMYTYLAGELTPLETVHARAVLEPPLHMGNAPRQGFHSPTRGSTGRDERQSVQEAAFSHMARAVIERALQAAGEDGWIAVGGIPRASKHIAEEIALTAAGRILRIESLDVHATDTVIADAARAAGSSLRNQHDLRRIRSVAEKAGADGRGALGRDATERALQEGRVRELFISHRLLEYHAAETERAVRAALEQRASVEEVSGPAADVLNVHGGMAAELRYSL